VKHPGRHISSALFSALLLLPFLAIGFLQIGQLYIQSDREERLGNEELVKVILPAKDVVWEEEGKELWVGERMFDVASYSIVDGHYHLLGIYDEDETEVAGSLLHILLSKNESGFLQLLLLLQCFCITAIFLSNSLQLVWLQRVFASFSISLHSRSHVILGPPPKQ